MRRLLLTTLVLALACVPALAATPGSGTVSAAAPTVRWTGTVAGEGLTGAALFAIGEAGGTRGQCRAPACDAFALTVADAGATKLTVTVRGETADDYVALEVQEPDGDSTYVYDAADTAALTLAKPAKGAYAVRVLGSPAAPNPDMDYTAGATLEIPPPADAPPAPESSRPPAEPAPPSPAPAPGDGSPAARPAAPAPDGTPTLAARADARRLRRAVAEGFRVRTVCSGGCAKVKVRAFVSPLTARQMGLSNGRDGEVEVARAPVARNAEGRRVHLVVFKPTARRRLVRSRRFTMAVETVATDPGGRVRAFTQLITLKR